MSAGRARAHPGDPCARFVAGCVASLFVPRVKRRSLSSTRRVSDISFYHPWAAAWCDTDIRMFGHTTRIGERCTATDATRCARASPRRARDARGAASTTMGARDGARATAAVTTKPRRDRMTRAIASTDVDAVFDALAGDLATCGDGARRWCDRRTVERFVRADKGDVVKATKRLRRTVRWRDGAKPEETRCERCFEGDFGSHYMQQIGFDACGRAVVYSDIGLALDGKPASNVEHCVQVLELLERFLPEYPYDQYVWVCDFHKLGAGSMNPNTAMKCLSLFARSYPERLEMMIFVEAPKLFNGLYKMLTAFVDPVTVQKLRFVKGPSGKGGGGSLAETFDELLSEETSKWLTTEMRMNREMWSVVKTKKSWIKSMIIENGVMEEAAAFPDFASHDCRGTDEFLNSPAGAHAAAFVKRHALGSKLAAKERLLPEFCAPIEDEAEDARIDQTEALTKTFSFVKLDEVVDARQFDRFE